MKKENRDDTTTIITSNTQGYDGGMFYSFWTESSGPSMTLDGGNGYSAEWTNVGNFTCGKGWKPGSAHSVYFSGGYSNNAGGGSFGIYGWTISELIEYYIVEMPSNGGPQGTYVGSYTSDGSSYKVYKNQQINKPSIISQNSTFWQYISIRQSPRTKGIITIANHFAAWGSFQLQLGSTFDYQTLGTESWGGSGNSNVKIWEVTRLSAFYDNLGQHVFYVSTDGHVHQLYWNGSWQDQNLTALTNGAKATSGTPITSFADGSGEHVFYVSSNGHIHQLYYNGSWQDQNITASANGPSVTPGASITSFADGNGNEHVYYVATDGQVHELLWNGTSWGANSPGGSLALTGGGISAFSDASGLHVFFVGKGDGHVHQLYWNGSWQDQDLTVLVNSPVATPGASITSFTDGNGNEHVFYVATDGQVHELLWNGVSWAANSPGGSLACAGGGISAFSDASGLHVFFVGKDDGHVHQLYWNGSWQDQDLTALASGQSAIQGSGIASYSDGNGNVHIIFAGSDNNMYELLWNNKNWQQNMIGTRA